MKTICTKSWNISKSRVGYFYDLLTL